MKRSTSCGLAGLLALVFTALVGAGPAPPTARAHTGDDRPVIAATATSAARSTSLSGELQRIHGHVSSRDRQSVAGWMLTTAGGRRVPLDFASGLRPRAGAQVRVRGMQRGSVLRVRSLRRVPGAVTARAAAHPTGAKRTAVVLFNFSDDRSRPFTVDQVREALFTGPRSVSSFYAAESHGKLSLAGRDRTDGDVYGWLEIDASGVECFGGDDWDWYAKADAAAAAAGADLGGYDHVVYVHPRVQSCGFAGIATLGGNWSSLNGTIGLWVAGHEIGHNYEFEHAGRLYCKDTSDQPVAVGGTCSVGEYDDPYDIMGNRFQRHSSAVRQLQAGWIPQSNLRTVTGPGTYDIAPLAESSAAVQVLRVPRGDGRSYWLEFRRPHGAFDDFALTEPVVNGVTIRLAGGLDAPGVTQLVDTNPATARATRDEPLAVGRTFTDSEQLIRVTTESAGAGGARVTIRFGAAAQGEVPVPATGTLPGASTPPQAPGGAPATNGRTAPSPQRFLPRRASANRRPLAAARLAAADGHGLTVLGRGGSATLDLRFAPGAAVAGRSTRLELRLRTPRRCAAEVSVRGATGRWATVGRIRTGPAWTTVRVALKAGALAAGPDVRLACRGTSPVLEIDSAVLRSS